MGKRKLQNLSGAFALFLTTAGIAHADCSEGSLAIRGEFGSARFTIDVADDAQERAQGLMFVEDMPTMQGMLFVYERPQSVSFWMRNTLIPLDMVFADGTGRVVNIHSNAQPLDETPIFGGQGVQYVLEINGGMADRLGLAVGDFLQHPAIKPDPIWPC